MDVNLQPPRYTVDLSLPPERRYEHIAKEFQDLSQLKPVFDELLAAQIRLIPKPLRILIARLIFRRLYDREEDLEIKGISKATGVALHLLVAFNVLLDLFMGCTSGGVRVQEEDSGQTKMLHFRTLDWGMDVLRKLVVELNFVDRAGGPFIATSVTYFGYVGVLTGVRKGLSISLNFRPNHDQSTLRKRLAFPLHQMGVLLGRRRGVASTLRNCLLPRANDKSKSAREIAEELKPQKSTASYLIFSDGKTTVCMDNDYKAARIVEASDFIFMLNHDFFDEYTQALEELCQQQGVADDKLLSDSVIEEYKRRNKKLGSMKGILDLVECSIWRKICMEKLWRRDRMKLKDHEVESFGVCPATVVRKWMEEGLELVNSATHYGVIMDPEQGNIQWLQRYLEPVQPAWDSASQEQGLQDGGDEIQSNGGTLQNAAEPDEAKR